MRPIPTVAGWEPRLSMTWGRRRRNPPHRSRRQRIPGPAVDLARFAGAELTRGDYRRLVAARLCAHEDIAAADDETLLACLDADHRRLAVVRSAAAALAAALEHANDQPPPQLAPYAA